MSSQVTILPGAVRQLQRLDPPLQTRIREKIRSLAEDPRPAQSKLLKGEERYHRLRFGVYRVIYRIEESRLIVLVVRIGHRREVYRRR